MTKIAPKKYKKTKRDDSHTCPYVFNEVGKEKSAPLSSQVLAKQIRGSAFSVSRLSDVWEFSAYLSGKFSCDEISAIIELGDEVSITQAGLAARTLDEYRRDRNSIYSYLQAAAWLNAEKEFKQEEKIEAPLACYLYFRLDKWALSLSSRYEKEYNFALKELEEGKKSLKKIEHMESRRNETQYEKILKLAGILSVPDSRLSDFFEVIEDLLSDNSRD